MMTGRPTEFGNTLCTPTCLGEAKQAELPLNSCHPTRRAVTEPRTEQNTLSGYSIGDVFRERLQSPSHEISARRSALRKQVYMTTDGRLGKHDPRDSRDPENGAQTSPWAAVPKPSDRR